MANVGRVCEKRDICGGWLFLFVRADQIRILRTSYIQTESNSQDIFGSLRKSSEISFQIGAKSPHNKKFLSEELLIIDRNAKLADRQVRFNDSGIRMSQ